MFRTKFIAGVLVLGIVGACESVPVSEVSDVTAAEYGIIDNLAAVIVPVSDLEVASSFYLEALGASVIREMEVDAYKEQVLSLPGGENTRIVLIESKILGSSLKPVRLVFNTHRAKDAVANAVELGAKIVSEAAPVQGAGVTIGIVQDADGNKLEFIER